MSRCEFLHMCRNVYYLLPILVMSCLSFNTVDGKHYISRLIIVILVIGFFMNGAVIINNIKKTKVSMAFWLPIAFVLSCYHLIGGEAFGTPRVIFLSFLYILIVPWSSISRQNVLSAIVLGGIAAGMFSVYERELLNIRRVGGDVNQIPFSLYVAMTLLIAIFSLKVYQHKIMKSFALISIVGAGYALIMSEVRGVWLAILCVVIMAMLNHATKITIRKNIMMAVIMLLSLQILSATDAVSSRVVETKNEFAEIINGNQDTSIGIRLQLWRSAIEIIKAHPFMGVGTQGYQHIMEVQHQQGLITSTALSFKNTHFHNQYLDSYVRYGVIGLVISILMCLSPLLLYRNYSSDVNKMVVFVSVLLLVAGITDVPFIHTGIIYMLVVYPAVIALTQDKVVPSSLDHSQPLA